MSEISNFAEFQRYYGFGEGLKRAFFPQICLLRKKVIGGYSYAVWSGCMRLLFVPLNIKYIKFCCQHVITSHSCSTIEQRKFMHIVEKSVRLFIVRSCQINAWLKVSFFVVAGELLCRVVCSCVSVLIVYFRRLFELLPFYVFCLDSLIHKMSTFNAHDAPDMHVCTRRKIHHINLNFIMSK